MADQTPRDAEPGGPGDRKGPGTGVPQGRVPEEERRRWRFGIGTLFLILVVVGVLGSMIPFVVSGFSLDTNEKALATRFAEVPVDETRPLSSIVPGAWSDVCVLNTVIDDPGKTRKPEPMDGMLIPPMRNHKVYLESGYWVIVSLNAEGRIIGEYRVDPSVIANRPSDNGGNFCAPRGKALYTLKLCDKDCERRIVFEKSDDAPAS